MLPSWPAQPATATPAHGTGCAKNTLKLLLWDAMAGGDPPRAPQDAFLFPFGFTLEDIRNEMCVGLKMQVNYAKATQWVFFERPAWTIGQLYERYEPMEAKHELHRIAYLCISGAWNGVLFRFNYDPRLDIDARFFQTIYWRLPSDPKMNVLRKHIFSTVWANMVRIAQEQNTSTYEVRKGIEPPLRFQGIELAEVNLWMFCDIRAKEVRQILNDLRYCATCTPRFGHFSPVVFPFLISLLKRKAYEFANLRESSTLFSKGFMMGEEEALPFMLYIKDNSQRLPQWTEPQRPPPSVLPPRVGVAWDEAFDDATLQVKIEEEGPSAAMAYQASEAESRRRRSEEAAAPSPSKRISLDVRAESSATEGFAIFEDPNSDSD